jgi:hypothetical protein
MPDLSQLSDRERFEFLLAMLKAGKGPRAGRPRKDSEIPRWADIGFTRKEVWRMRRLAEIPKEDFDAFLDSPRKRSSFRSTFVRFNKINVPSENDFDGTPLGELASSLMAPCERLLDSGALNARERRLVKRAVLARLKQIFR